MLEIQSYNENLKIARNLSKKLIKIRIYFFKELLSKYTYKFLYDNSVKFMKSSKNLMSILKDLSSLSQGKKMNCLMIKLFYYSQIEDTPKKVEEILEEIRSINNILKLNIDDLKIDDKESIVLSVQLGGKDTHKIQMADGGVEKLLNYSKRELEGKDLSVIIDGPMAQQHKNYFQQVDISGRRLQSRLYIEDYCRDKDGNLIPVSIMIKLTYLNDTGLAYMGLIVYDNDKNDGIKEQILVSKDGSIIGRTKPFNMQEKQTITQDSMLVLEQLGNVIPLLSLFFEGYSQDEKCDSLDIDKMMESKIDSFLWEVYLYYKHPSLLTYINSKGENCNVWIKIENKCYRSGNQFLFYWVISILQNDNVVTKYKENVSLMRKQKENETEEQMLKLINFSLKLKSKNSFNKEETKADKSQNKINKVQTQNWSNIMNTNLKHEIQRSSLLSSLISRDQSAKFLEYLINCFK